MKAAFVLFIAACSVACYGQSTNAAPKKTLVYLECQCNDPVGGRIATAFRDRLAVSPRYEESTDEKVPALHLNVISIDPSQTQENNGIQTIYSAVVTAGPNYYLTHSVQLCGANNVDTCAADLITLLDSILHGR